MLQSKYNTLLQLKVKFAHFAFLGIFITTLLNREVESQQIIHSM